MQANDESISDYYRRFDEIHSMVVDVSDKDVIEYFGNSLKERFQFTDSIKHKPETTSKFHRIVQRIIDAEE